MKGKRHKGLQDTLTKGEMEKKHTTKEEEEDGDGDTTMNTQRNENS